MWFLQQEIAYTSLYLICFLNSEVAHLTKTGMFCKFTYVVVFIYAQDKLISWKQFKYDKCNFKLVGFAR